jgi:hypothetical protein
MTFHHSSQTVSAAVLLCLGICSPVHGRTLPETSSPAAGVHENTSKSQPDDSIVIPGPLRSFLRMAGISQQISPEDVLPMLARNASLYGYYTGRETEFLVLLDRYVHQARELQILSDEEGMIRVTGCNDATRLIQILGYRFQRQCRKGDASLATENAERAFVTLDSGFPLTTLEQALQKGEPFSYPFPATPVPVFFEQKEWMDVSTWKRRPNDNLLDVLMHDQDLDRLYAAFARCDQETRSGLMHSPGLR